MAKKRKVIIRRCNDYDVSAINGMVKEAMEELGERPSGKILIKPNVVCATSVVQGAHTNPSVIEGVIGALKGQNPRADIRIGESGGQGVPTRLFFAHTGWPEVSKRTGVPLYDFNEERQVEVKLKRAKWHTTMLAAKSLYEANYKIWMPKLKYHSCCHITNALKLNIGILTHKERPYYHDDRLDEKIVDLLELGYPNLIVCDAVDIGYANEFAPYLYRLGAIIIGNEPLAVDMVGARILNYRPEDVAHLVEAKDRGYGSLNYKDIEVAGDVSMDELAEKAAKIKKTPLGKRFALRFDLEKVDFPIKFYIGDNPERQRKCTGGCAGALSGLLALAEQYHPGQLSHVPKSAIVMGVYKGDVVHPGETVALLGSCTEVQGKFEAGKVIRLDGCPAKGMKQGISLLPKLGIKSPSLEASIMAEGAFYNVIKGIMCSLKIFHRRVGKPGVPGLERA